MTSSQSSDFCPAVLLGICLLASTPLFAAKTDVVELLNGDHITGEVSSLDRGLLKFSTDNMGTLSIEWESVASVQSKQVLEVELKSGERWYGQFADDAAPGTLRVAGDNHAVKEVFIADTVRITALEESSSLRDRIDSSVDFGFTDTKANDVTQYSFDAEFSYRDRLRLWDITLNTIQSKTGGTQAGSATLKGEQRRFFGNRWFWSGLLQFEQNDEQDLDLRTSLGGGLGRNITQSNHQTFAMGMGLVLAREDLADGQQTDSIEVMIGFDYDAFRFDDPELDLTANLVVLPSLTVSGRVRSQASISLRYEIIDDFFAELTLSDTYDSKPQSVGAQKNDYSVTTSLGYSF